MAVGVQCQRDLAVPEGLHDHPSRDALGEHETGGGVPEIVEPKTGQAGPLQSGLEPPRDVPRVERRPQGGGEYEVRVVPACASRSHRSQSSHAGSVSSNGRGPRAATGTSDVAVRRLLRRNASKKKWFALGKRWRPQFVY